MVACSRSALCSAPMFSFLLSCSASLSIKGDTKVSYIAVPATAPTAAAATARNTGDPAIAAIPPMLN